MARRIQSLEDRIASIERGKVSVISYFQGSKAACEAKRAELAASKPGTCMAMLEETGEGNFTRIWVLFPTGWVSF